MILCPNCRHKEMVGAIFCSQCGARLVVSENPTSTAIYPTNSLHQVTSASPDVPYPDEAKDVSMALSILDEKKLIPLGGRRDFTLGRASEGQPIIPDVDLTPFGAYENGVSRMHAVIRMSDLRITITDLGSANGTRVNGKKLTPHVANPIRHGDVLFFGRLKAQILIRPDQA